MKRLEREFFTRDGITLAKELLGKVLVHDTGVGTVRGIITETESYMGEQDKGSHTYGGKRTARTEPMYQIGGTSYIYLIYGIYDCMNIAAMVKDIPQAVLLRRVIPADPASRERMERLRLLRVGKRAASVKKHLADGPGKLCIAMGITREHNNVDLVTSKEFYVTDGLRPKTTEIFAGKRIGIDYAGEAADLLWRFYLKEADIAAEGGGL